MSVERLVLRQQRDLGQVVEAAFSLYLQNVRPLLTIAAVTIPLGIANAAFLEAIDDPGVEGAIFPFISLAQIIVDILVATALIAALQEIDAGRPPVFARAYGVAFSRFWTAIGAILRVGFHVLLFAITIVGIPWAIQRAVRWLFVLQAVILDGTSARAALSYSVAALEDVALWHERDISHSSVERIILPDACLALDYALDLFTNIMRGLLVYPDRMRENMEASYGLPFSQRVLLALIEHDLSRQEAYAIVQRNAMQSWKERRPFRQLLEADAEVTRHLSASDLDGLFDYAYYTRYVDESFRRLGLA